MKKKNEAVVTVFVFQNNIQYFQLDFYVSGTREYVYVSIHVFFFHMEEVLTYALDNCILKYTISFDLHFFKHYP